MAGELPVRMQRTNLVVSDLDRAFRVYQDILGFRVDFILGDRPQAYSYTVFQIPREAKTRFAALSSSGHERSLALTEVKVSICPSLGCQAVTPWCWKWTTSTPFSKLPRAKACRSSRKKRYVRMTDGWAARSACWTTTAIS